MRREHVANQSKLFGLASTFQLLLQFVCLVEIVRDRVLVAIGHEDQRVATRFHCLVDFFFNDTPSTEIYTLSLHDALPISQSAVTRIVRPAGDILVVMSACCDAIEGHFDVAKVRSKLEALERSGPEAETQLLIDLLTKAGVGGCRLLDIGAGLGVIAEQLLGAGAREAILVDLSPAYTEGARRRLAQKGLIDRAAFETGDFLDLAAGIEAAEIVTLDKVICCYPDMAPLVEQSARKALRFYAATYPRDNWAARLSIGLENLGRRLRRKPFRAYVHPVTDIEQLVRANGFEPRAVETKGMWRIVLFERRAGP